MAQKGLELPKADRKEQLQDAPIITVTKSDLSFQGFQVATIESLLKDENPQMKIEALFLKLDAHGKKTKETMALSSKATESGPRRPATTPRPASPTTPSSAPRAW